ncbi:MAG: hypothetical protein ACO1OB_01025 [Archangium sp.]
MRRAIQTVLLVLSLSVAASAFAANGRQKPTEYQEVTDEDRAAARERARNRVSTWTEANMPEEYEFPWMRIGFVVLAFAIATPFALIAYRNSSQELKEHTAFTQQKTRRKAATTDEA